MDDDAALQAIVKKALEGKGVMSQIRASLRAAVFTCVDERERISGVHVPNPTALRVNSELSGRLALQVVADFLSHFELNKTLSVLKMETNTDDDDLLSRRELASILSSVDGDDELTCHDESPAIIQLLAQNRAPIWGGKARGAGDGELESGETVPSQVALGKRAGEDVTGVNGSTQQMYATVSHSDGQEIMSRMEKDEKFRPDGQIDESAYDFTDRARATAVPMDRQDATQKEQTTGEGEEKGNYQRDMQVDERAYRFTKFATAANLDPPGQGMRNVGKRTAVDEDEEGILGERQIGDRTYDFTERASAIVVNSDRDTSSMEEMRWGCELEESFYRVGQIGDDVSNLAQHASATAAHSDRQDIKLRLGTTAENKSKGFFSPDNQRSDNAHDNAERASAFGVPSNRQSVTGTLGTTVGGEGKGVFHRGMQMDDSAYDCTEPASVIVIAVHSNRKSVVGTLGMATGGKEEEMFHRGMQVDESGYNCTERASAIAMPLNRYSATGSSRTTVGGEENTMFHPVMRMDNSAVPSNPQDTGRAAVSTTEIGEHEGELHRMMQTDKESVYDFTELASAFDPGMTSAETAASGIMSSGKMTSEGLLNEAVAQPTVTTSSMSRLPQSGLPGASAPTCGDSGRPLRSMGYRLGGETNVEKRWSDEISFGDSGGIRRGSNEAHEGGADGSEDDASKAARCESAPPSIDNAPGDVSRVDSTDGNVEVSGDVLGSDGGYGDEDCDGSENYEEDAFEGEEADEPDAVEEEHQEADPGSDDDGMEVIPKEEDQIVLVGENSADEILFDASLSEVSRQEGAQKADAEWEISADSSFSGVISESFDEQGYHFEDARSV